MAYKSFNPYTLKLEGEYDFINDVELASAVESSQKAFMAWKETDLHKRTGLLIRMAELLEDEAEIHAKIVTSEMAKPIKQAIAEIRKSALACRYYAKEAERILKPKVIESPGSRSTVMYEPQGIVFAIMPWNYPYWQVIRCFAPAIASGNSLILKHASNVPACSQKLEDTAVRAGFPDGLFQNLFLTHVQTASLIGHRYVRTISLTGSNLAGEIIAARAGEVTKSCVMELGGSDPFIVFDDADIEKAAEAAVTGRFQNSGQSCIATKRIFLHAAIYDSFISRFKEHVQNLKLGDPMNPDTDIGPLVDKSAVLELRRQVRESVEMGATITCGELVSKAGAGFFDPMILENVPLYSPVAVEETFGPVIPVFRFTDYNEMLKMVNSSIFGLGSSVWTKSRKIIDRISKDIDSGMLTINAFSRSDPALPFGGVKSSGFGRELSDNGMMEFLNIKTVSVFE